MKTKIELDLKSLLIGASAAAVCFLCAGATGGSLSGGNGHFEVSVGGNGCAAVVNTATGQVWTAHIRENDGQAVGLAGNNTFLTKKDD